ncbi:MAG: hypothetical protein VKQ33_07430 [Candidatus Sericytochromatia bacterium]|nr:hypothetical protein [Candidatus Sericytochromatia bacterium]
MTPMPQLSPSPTPAAPTTSQPDWLGAFEVVEAGAGHAQELVDAKVLHAATTAPAFGAAASAINSARKDDHVQLAVDALKLSAATIAKNSAAESSLVGSSQLLTGVKKAIQGDAFGTATAMTMAAEKLAPALSTSGVGAFTNVVLLGLGDDKVRAQAQAVEEQAKLLVEPHASGVERVKAALDLSVGLQGLANLARTLAQSLVNVASYGVRAMRRTPVLAPTATSLSMVAREMAATPGGRLLGKLNHWLPLVNIAGVALSGKTTLDVFRTPHASAKSKVLALASLATSVVAVFAAVNLGVAPFIGVLATSIAIDLGLARSRRDDARQPKAQGTGAQAPVAASRRPLRLVG